MQPTVDAARLAAGALHHRQTVQVNHQFVDRHSRLLYVQRLHLLEHELGQQLFVSFELGDSRHAPVELAPDRGRLFVARVQLECIVEELVLELFDVQNVLEHLVELLLAHAGLVRAGARRRRARVAGRPDTGRRGRARRAALGRVLAND